MEDDTIKLIEWLAEWFPSFSVVHDNEYGRTTIYTPEGHIGHGKTFREAVADLKGEEE